MDRFAMMSFDELAAEWMRHWPWSTFALEFLGHQTWQCRIVVPRESDPLFPPGGFGDTPTEALRAVLIQALAEVPTS